MAGTSGPLYTNQSNVIGKGDIDEIGSSSIYHDEMAISSYGELSKVGVGAAGDSTIERNKRERIK